MDVRITTGTYLATAALVLSSCAPRELPKDELRLVVASPPEALDPRFVTSAVAWGLSPLVFAPLFLKGDDLQAHPYLAESLTRVDDVTYDVVLGPGRRFHNGEPVRAVDVVYTFGALGSDDVKSPHAAKFERVLRVEAINERTARFVLKAPFAAFPIELTAIGIVSRKHCEGRTAACREQPMGAGPFRAELFDASTEELVMTSFEGWLPRPPSIPRIRMRVVRDGTTRLLELIDGKADLVVGDIAPTQLDAVARYPQLAVQRRPGLGYSYLAMNLRPPNPDHNEEVARTRRALADVRVRRAVAHALDIDVVIRTKLRGAAQRATGMLPPGHWAKDPGLVTPAYDPDAARKLMDEAGFLDRGPDDGGRFSVVLNTTTDRLRRSIAVIFAHQLREVGIDVGIRVGEWATLYQDIKRGAFEMFSAKWTPVIEPDLMHWVFHSSNIPGPGTAGGNRGAFIDTEVDGWIEDGRTLLDPAARAVPYAKVERRLLESLLPYVPLWFEDQIAVHRTDLKDFELARTGAYDGLAAARLERTR